MPEGAVTYEFLKLKPGAERAGATARAYAVLRESIISLDLRPGQMLDKQAIAVRLGVSRFPVTEAIGRLASEGLAEIIPQSGSRVALIRLSDARENMFLRRALEIETVRHLAVHAPGQLIDALRQNLWYQHAAIETGDPAGFHGFDLAFHALLQDELGFSRIRTTAETARLALERVRRLLNTRRRLEITLAEHVAIVEAIASGDPDEAGLAMRQHLDEVLAELERVATDRPELFADLTLREGQSP